MTNKKITQLTPMTDPQMADVLPIVDDPAGTPATKKVTLQNLGRAPFQALGFSNNGAKPTVPASGDYNMYIKSGRLYMQDSAGTESEVAAGTVSPGLSQVRLSLSQTDPNPSEELTRKATLYALPFLGNRITLYDPVAGVYVDTLVENGVKANLKTLSRTGDTVNGSNILSDFSGNHEVVFAGYEISGTNIPAGTTVVSVDHDAHTITMSAAATGDGNDVTLTLAIPAASKWDVFAYLVAGTMRLYLLKWSNSTTRATELVLGDGVLYLTGAQQYKYLGTITVSGLSGELEDSSVMRGIVNHYKVPGGLWRLDKGPAFALAGGWMPTVNKQAATWTFTGGGGWSNTANVYDGSDATYGVMSTMTTRGFAMIDFGGPVVLEKMSIRMGSSAGNIINNARIQASATGVFGGEEVTLATSTSFSINTTTEISFTRSRYRYWRVEMWHSVTGSAGHIYEIGFYLSSTMAFSGIPYGCMVGLYDAGGSLIEEHQETGYKFYEFLDFAAANVTDAVRAVITRPDGATEWLRFGLAPVLGDVYTLLHDS